MKINLLFTLLFFSCYAMQDEDLQFEMDCDDFVMLENGSVLIDNILGLPTYANFMTESCDYLTTDLRKLVESKEDQER